MVEGKESSLHLRLGFPQLRFAGRGFEIQSPEDAFNSRYWSFRLHIDCDMIIQDLQWSWSDTSPFPFMFLSSPEFLPSIFTGCVDFFNYFQSSHFYNIQVVNISLREIVYQVQ